METIHQLVLWILVGCHHTGFAKHGKNRLDGATTVQFVPRIEKPNACLEKVSATD